MTSSPGPAVSPPGAASLETATGQPPKMKRKEYERQMRLLHGELVANRAGVEPVMGFCTRDAMPPTPRDITLPKRQPPHGYVQPDLPLRYIPAPF